MPPADGGIEALWRTYYEAMFNPARVNLRGHAARDAAAALAAAAGGRADSRLVQPRAASDGPVDGVGARRTAGPSVRPGDDDLDELRAAAPPAAAATCIAAPRRWCLARAAPKARLVLVGEQPGDRKTSQGGRSLGPAGEVLDRALAAAGIDRHGCIITNAVKHFSWEPRGKRRIHQTPRISEMRACRPWLEAELHIIRPDVVVCLGATAARALLGPQARVIALRGKVLEGLAWAPRVIVTVHPSAVLRTTTAPASTSRCWSTT